MGTPHLELMRKDRGLSKTGKVDNLYVELFFEVEFWTLQSIFST